MTWFGHGFSVPDSQVMLQGSESLQCKRHDAPDLQRMPAHESEPVQSMSHVDPDAQVAAQLEVPWQTTSHLAFRAQLVEHVLGIPEPIAAAQLIEQVAPC